MVRSALALGLGAAAGLACAELQVAFVGQGVPGTRGATRPAETSDALAAHHLEPVSLSMGATQEAWRAEPWASIKALCAGLCLGVALLFVSPQTALADVEEVTIPVDGKGKSMSFTREQYLRAKRLFNNACSSCHAGGITKVNQNVGLSIEELNGAVPPRNNIDAIVNFLNSPMTYDNLVDISETHPSIKAADVWPKMRSMKQQDLYDLSAYILYQNQTMPEMWGGGKQYY